MEAIGRSQASPHTSRLKDLPTALDDAEMRVWCTLGCWYAEIPLSNVPAERLLPLCSPVSAPCLRLHGKNGAQGDSLDVDYYCGCDAGALVSFVN